MSEAEPQSPRRQRLVLGAFLAAQTLYASLAVYRHAFPLWQARWVQDDAYVSFRYAKHLAEGHGLVYNLGARVEGYTNFLWTLCAAFPLAIGAPDPLPFMHLLSMVLWAGTYALLIALGVRLFREGIWIAPLAVLPLLDHWSYNMWFISAMETPLVSFLTVAALFCFALDPERHRFSLLWASLIGVALTMTRPDGVLVLVALALAGVLLYGRRILQRQCWGRYLGLPLLPILCVYVPYNVWRIRYYGSFFPNTYYTKVAYLTDYARGWEYLKAYLTLYPFWPLLLVLVPGAVLAVTGSARRFVWSALLTAGCVAFYVVRLGGDFMEWRFVTPATGVLYPAIVICGAVVGEGLWPLLAGRLRAAQRFPDFAPRVAGWAAGAATLVLLARATQQATPTALDSISPGQETIPLLSRYCDPHQFNWGAAGRLFDQVLPKNVTIATTSAGIIPFFCDRPCLDLHGLTDPEIAHEPVDPNNRGRMGHEHWLQDYDRMRARGVDIFLYWVEPKPYALSLVTPAKKNLEMVSARLPDGRYVEFLILNHAAVDVDALRKDPRLVFYGDVPVSDRGALVVLHERYAGYTTVDTLDMEDAASYQEHDFEEIFAPGAEHLDNYHPKMLAYRAPFNNVTVFDVGRIINHEARWQVHHVSAQKDLVVVVRYDRTGNGVYRLEVNGHPVPGTLTFHGGPRDAWDEVALTIPANLLVDGANEMRLIHTDVTAQSSELYYMWFLQKHAED